MCVDVQVTEHIKTSKEQINSIEEKRKKKIDKNIKHENIIKTEHKFHQISPEKKKKLKKKGDEC